MSGLSIKQAEQRTGLPAKTIRYYEDIDLVRPARAGNGYRVFDETDIHKLAFLGKARGLGFTVNECRRLLELYNDDNRASADVKALAKQHVSAIETKIEELHAMRATLHQLIQSCAGNDRPDCPILDELAGTQQS